MPSTLVITNDSQCLVLKETSWGIQWWKWSYSSVYLRLFDNIVSLLKMRDVGETSLTQYGVRHLRQAACKADSGPWLLLHDRRVSYPFRLTRLGGLIHCWCAKDGSDIVLLDRDSNLKLWFVEPFSWPCVSFLFYFMFPFKSSNIVEL